MSPVVQRLLMIPALLAGWTALAQTDLETALGAYQRDDYDTAYQQFRKLAEQGQPEAQYYTGAMLENAQGVSRDYEEAAQWYRKAADQGNAQAQNALGMLYETGIGVPKNYEKAADWYQKAANQGFAPAQRNLGQLYRQGLGVPQDQTKAAALLQQAAAQGDREAQKGQGAAPAAKGYEAAPVETPPRPMTSDRTNPPTPSRTFDTQPPSSPSPAGESTSSEPLQPGLYIAYHPAPETRSVDVQEMVLLECTVENRPTTDQITGTFYDYQNRSWRDIGTLKGAYYYSSGKFKGVKAFPNQSDQDVDGNIIGTNWLTLEGNPMYICRWAPNLAGNYFVEGDRTKKCKVAQNKAFLDFTDEQGKISKGIFWSYMGNEAFSVKALDWPNYWATLEDDYKTIRWAHGVKWVKTEKLDVANLAGPWQVENDPTKKCFIKQTGENLQVTDENGKISSGHFENYTTVVVDLLYGTNNLSGRYDGFTRRLEWANNITWTQGLAAVNTFTLTGKIVDPDQKERFLHKITETEFSWLGLDAQFKTNVLATLTVATPPAGVMASDTPAQIKLRGEIKDPQAAEKKTTYLLSLNWKGDDAEVITQRDSEPRNLLIGQVEGKWVPQAGADFKFFLPEFKGKKLYLELLASPLEGGLDVWLRYVYERQ